MKDVPGKLRACADTLIHLVRVNLYSGGEDAFLQWEKSFRAALSEGGEWADIEPAWEELRQFLPPTLTNPKAQT